MKRLIDMMSRMGGYYCPRRILIIAGVIAAAFFGFLYYGCGNVSERTARKAYDLRISGKADDAKALLEDAIAESPGDAIAHYELSRILFHMGLGKGREIFDYIERARNSIDKAVELDPENVIYRYFAGRIAFMQAYVSLQGSEETAGEKVRQLCELYESVLKLKPDYHEAQLFLVEIYGALPKNLGGDSSRAELYASQLEKADPVLGAKARVILLPGTADLVEYWRKVVEDHPGNLLALEELGRTCLRHGQGEEGIKQFEEVLKADPDHSILLLDIARFHIMGGMRDAGVREKNLPLVEAALNRYLDTNPIIPLKAYALGLKAKVKYGFDKEEADKLNEEAMALDPYYSRAFGVPTPDLFVPVGEESHDHSYLFQPF